MKYIANFDSFDANFDSFDGSFEADDILEFEHKLKKVCEMLRIRVHSVFLLEDKNLYAELHYPLKKHSNIVKVGRKRRFLC